MTGAQLGTKTVTETVAPGWTLTNIVCTGARRRRLRRDRRLRPGRHLRDPRRGGRRDRRVHLHQHQGRVGQDHQGRRPRRAPQNFNFDGTGTGITADFDLDDDADRPLPRKTPSRSPAPSSAPRRSPSPSPTGWTLTNIVCTGDDDGVYGATGGFVQRRHLRDPRRGGRRDRRVHLHQHQGRAVKIVKDAVPDGAPELQLRRHRHRHHRRHRPR